MQKKVFRSLVLSLFVIFSLAVAPVSAATLSSRLKGMILLPVQGKGELWYVNSIDGKRHLLGTDSQALYQTKMLAVQLDEKAFRSYTIRGRFFMLKTDQSRVWYIEPKAAKRYYFDGTSGSFRFLHTIALGILDRDLSQIPASMNVSSVPVALNCLDIDCFINAVKQKRFVVLRSKDAFSPVPSTQRLTFQPTKEFYAYQNYTVPEAVVFSDADKAQLRQSGESETEIQTYQSEMSGETFWGLTQDCTFTNLDAFVAALERWKKGSLSTNDLDFAQCVTSGLTSKP